MRYLAEVQKQSKGFMGGFDSKLKLLACQDSDRGWNIVSGKESIDLEDTGNLGDGALVMVSIGTNGQIQGTLEPASARIIGILQSFSRLLEKSKSQEEEIETWKESLTIQSEQLSTRELEMETRLEQLERMEEEFNQFEPQRQEIAKAKQEAEKLKAELEAQQKTLAQEKEQILQEQQRLEANLKEGKFLDESQVLEIQNLLESLSVGIHPRENLTQDLNLALQQLDIASTAGKLQKERLKLEKKRELISIIEEQKKSQTAIQDRLNCAGIESSGVAIENKLDVKALENMPLSELESIVADLQKDLEKVAQFVHDQEEELSWQCQAVEELEQKIKDASEFDRLALDQELAEEKEAKKMLDETLVGQRRSLKERHERFLQHSRILKRRQGIFDLEIELQEIDLEPIQQALEQQQKNLNVQKEALETEIQEIQEKIANLKEKLQAKIAQNPLLGEQIQEPFQIQDILKQIRQHLETMRSTTAEDDSASCNPSDVLTEIDRRIKELVI